MSALAALALNAGLPLLRGILSRRLGTGNGRLAAEVIRAVAERAGAAAPTEAALEDLARTAPGTVVEAMREVERTAPEMVQVYLAEAETRAALMAAEATEPLWVRAWRPLGMYGLGLLWLWQVILLHVANAVWKIALPPMPFDTLVQISGLYMGLYMGGHTVKDLAARWKGQG